jgi:hypothetical protein
VLASGFDEKHERRGAQVTLLDDRGNDLVRWREAHNYDGLGADGLMVVLLRTDGGWARAATLATSLTTPEAAAAVVASVVEVAVILAGSRVESS